MTILHQLTQVKGVGIAINRFALRNLRPRNQIMFLFYTNGQFILKCPFGVFKSSKKKTKFFPGFLP